MGDDAGPHRRDGACNAFSDRAATDNPDGAFGDFLAARAGPAAGADAGRFGWNVTQGGKDKPDCKFRHADGVGPLGLEDADATSLQQGERQIVDAGAVAADRPQTVGGGDDPVGNGLDARQPADTARHEIDQFGLVRHTARRGEYELESSLPKRLEFRRRGEGERTGGSRECASRRHPFAASMAIREISSKAGPEVGMTMSNTSAMT